MIFQGLQNRYDYITAKLTEIERELPHLPPGRLICGFYKGHPKYYLSSDKVRTYLSSKDATLIQQLSSCFTKGPPCRKESPIALYRISTQPHLPK